MTSAKAVKRSKVALVTGGARGNGLAIAKGLARAGATVFLADIAADLPQLPYPLASAGDLAQAEREVRALAPHSRAQVLDVRDGEAVRAAVADIEARTGGVDILVNNAGVLVLNPLTRVPDSEYDVQMDVIVRGAFHCCRAVLPGMNARGWGRIVNIASVAGHRGIGTGAVYSAAKHALVGLTRALAMEVANQGITVNAVCPGTVKTDLVRGLGAALKLDEDAAMAHLSARHLTGQPIQSDDVAAAVSWLASEAAGRINGTSLFVDDGWHVS
ncbi:MAG: SDR family oxidoreductase [Deltaproteobacteria bacterium]|nr:SDR family oxidoreductase [Deltaproteobacteria bacterium]